MDYRNEPYVRLYTRDTPTWIHMSWEARVTWPLLMRKLEREGKYDLGPWGFQGLADDLRIPVALAEAGVTGLVTAGVIVRRDGLLFAPNFYEAQNVTRAKTDAERQHDLRERRKIAKMATDQVVLPGTDTLPDRHDVTGPVTPSRSVHPLPLPSSAVPSSPVPSSPVPGGVGGSAPPTPPTHSTNGASHSKKKPSRRRGTRLEADWKPSRETIAAVRQELGVDPLCTVSAFVDYWTSKPGRRAEKLDWEAAFRTWCRRERASLPTFKPTPAPTPPRPPQERPLDPEHAAPFARATVEALEALEGKTGGAT